MLELENNNYVRVSGVVTTEPKFSHEVYGEGFYEFNIKIKRLSDIFDIIPVTISERLMNEKTIEVGEKVHFVGQYRSYNKLSENKSKLLLTIFIKEFLEVNEYDENEIEITGYVCKEPIYRTTPFNREICDVLIAVNRSYNKSDYIPCIAWGRNARFVKSFKIGDKVSVTGRIQSRAYQKKLDNGDIVTKTAYEVSLNKVSLENENNMQLSKNTIKTSNMGEIINYYV
ncbi:MAG: single-stranded DNA-binding protein [Clostridia bacterium]|nr:single-stranded DNA-binding protein [Clostridia bacterium]